MVKKKIKKNSVKSVSKPMGKWKPTPLKGTFMLAAMVGFFVSYYIIYRMSFNFGVTFMILFTVMFIASVISMTKAPVISEKM
ncbi:hypothetical protein HYX11_05515 [Candidatus Woesearchaeota archaeon]|nr:hypothetical protein [Candidatus Woesearchaeota archaeon]